MGNAHDWLAWFVRQQQTFCVPCRHFNEASPPSWWRGNCFHARVSAPSLHQAPGAI